MKIPTKIDLKMISKMERILTWIFDGFWCQLGSMLAPKIHQHPKKIDPKRHQKIDRFSGRQFWPCWLHLRPQVPPTWRHWRHLGPQDPPTWPPRGLKKLGCWSHFSTLDRTWPPRRPKTDFGPNLHRFWTKFVPNLDKFQTNFRPNPD